MEGEEGEGEGGGAPLAFWRKEWKMAELFLKSLVFPSKKLDQFRRKHLREEGGGGKGER